MTEGEIEHIPLPEHAVDVVISNCVINLSADNGQVLREAFRVLRPGGRFAVSDLVVQGQLPAEIRRSLEQWVGCVAGALDQAMYRRLLAEAGVEQVGLEVTRVFAAARWARRTRRARPRRWPPSKRQVDGTKLASTPWPQVPALVHRAVAESIGTAPLPPAVVDSGSTVQTLSPI
jgi:SAM-dependent methyltransferase